MNKQPIEKKTGDKLVDLHSLFLTIQGEGPFSGHRAVFVRLAGCNLRCPLCDTEYTAGRKKVEAAEVVRRVKEKLPDGGLVVITGGEPFRQPRAFEALVAEILSAGDYFIQVESNGTLPPPEGVLFEPRVGVSLFGNVYLIVSPKTGKVNERAMHRACAFKYVIPASEREIDPVDGLPLRALEHTASPKLARPPRFRNGNPAVPVYVQPVDYGNSRMNKRAREFVARIALEHGYIAQLQIHKELGVD